MEVKISLCGQGKKEGDYYIGGFCRTRVSSNGEPRTEKALLRVGRRGCERDCAGEVRRGRAERNRAEGNDGFRLPTILLELHSPSRNKDTSSVSLTLDTFTPELSPSGTLGVQVPLRGRLAKCDALRLSLAAPRPVLPTAHCPLLTAHYFTARAASPVRRRPASRSDH